MNKRNVRGFLIQLAIILVLAGAIAVYYLSDKPKPEEDLPPEPSVPVQAETPPQQEAEEPAPFEIEEVSETESMRAESGELIFRYILSLPKISGGGEGAADVVNSYYDGLREGIKKGDIKRMAELAQSDYSLPQFISAYSYSQDYEIVLNDGKNLSIRRITDTFEGGAQSQTAVAFDVFSFETGEKLPLSSLFSCPQEEYIPILMEKISVMIKSDPQKAEIYFATQPDELSQYFNPENFCLAEDSLIILFQSYDIAPNVAGIPEFKIPLSELSDILAKR